MKMYSVWEMSNPWCSVKYPKYSEASCRFESIKEKYGVYVEFIEHNGTDSTVIARKQFKHISGNGNRWKRRFLAGEFAAVEFSENYIDSHLCYRPGIERTQSFSNLISGSWLLYDRVRFYEKLIKQAGREDHRKHQNRKRANKSKRGCLDKEGSGS